MINSILGLLRASGELGESKISCHHHRQAYSGFTNEALAINADYLRRRNVITLIAPALNEGFQTLNSGPCRRPQRSLCARPSRVSSWISARRQERR